jgi:hypothetical protein
MSGDRLPDPAADVDLDEPVAEASSAEPKATGYPPYSAGGWPHSDA